MTKRILDKKQEHYQGISYGTTTQTLKAQNVQRNNLKVEKWEENIRKEKEQPFHNAAKTGGGGEEHENRQRRRE